MRNEWWKTWTYELELTIYEARMELALLYARRGVRKAYLRLGDWRNLWPVRGGICDSGGGP